VRLDTKAWVLVGWGDGVTVKDELGKHLANGRPVFERMTAATASNNDIGMRGEGA
jgi:hypothetical protein